MKSCYRKTIRYSRLAGYLSLLIVNCLIYAKTPREIQNKFRVVSLFQWGNASALFSGAIEGEMTFSELTSKGDFGLGTFNDIDGEMVALDGNFYKIGQKGKTVLALPDWKTPFVELVKFSPNKPLHFNNVSSYVILKQYIQKKFENKNIPYAIKVTGSFNFLKLRSRSARAALQVNDVIEDTYEVNNIKGTLVGFWFPAYLPSLTVPAFHFHFIADNRKISGHVLELNADYADVSINMIDRIELSFPQTLVYKKANIKAATLDKYNTNQMNDTKEI